MASLDLRSSSDLRAYLSVLWRFKFVILPFAVLLPLTAYLHANSATPVFEASATVLLNRESQSLSGISDPNVYQPDRMISTQTGLARLPAVAQLVVQSAHVPNLDVGSFLANSSVGSSPTANDLMTFRARSGDPAVAVRLTNLYARKFIQFRRQVDTDTLRAAEGGL
ncbi:MAG: Wzz/FepE/Etk N-terminal domain-containing protein, partial [Actinomycetota bacterium]|nr:Wzz/FepE/Etk N-terminal domain-containing protein [Actinomycetota bacterium]